MVNELVNYQCKYCGLVSRNRLDVEACERLGEIVPEVNVGEVFIIDENHSLFGPDGRRLDFTILLGNPEWHVFGDEFRGHFPTYEQQAYSVYFHEGRIRVIDHTGVGRKLDTLREPTDDEFGHVESIIKVSDGKLVKGSLERLIPEDQRLKNAIDFCRGEELYEEAVGLQRQLEALGRVSS